MLLYTAAKEWVVYFSGVTDRLVLCHFAGVPNQPRQPDNARSAKSGAHVPPGLPWRLLHVSRGAHAGLLRVRLHHTVSSTTGQFYD